MLSDKMRLSVNTPESYFDFKKTRILEGWITEVAALEAEFEKLVRYVQVAGKWKVIFSDANYIERGREGMEEAYSDLSDETRKAIEDD